ncbi:uncharacterized protein LOC144138032 isoform X2 [Haemaphysalis longicornis]
MAASPEETALAPEPAVWTCSACKEKLHHTERPAESEEAEEENEKELGELEKTMTEEERLSRNERALKLKEEGNVSFKRGQYADAVESYTQALKTCPLSSSAGESKLAILKDCSKAIELNPSYLKAILTRAWLNKEMGNLDEALKDYKRVLELDPSNEEARHACMLDSRKTRTNNHENRQDARTADSSFMKEQEEQRLKKEKIRKFCTVAGTAAALGVGAVVAAPLALAAVGFGSGGVVGGSLAAMAQSAIGNVAAGSTFAVLQSCGAAGIPVAAQTIIGVTGATVGGALGSKFSGSQTQTSDATKEGNEAKENQENTREEATRGAGGIKCRCAHHVSRNCQVTRCASCGHYIHSADVAGGTGDKTTPRDKV